MMKIERFEDILAWQKARELAKNIYLLSGQNRDYGFRDQIQRAGISIMSHIAEGFERRSGSEFRQFLYIAKGSCAEVRSHGPYRPYGFYELYRLLIWEK